MQELFKFENVKYHKWVSIDDVVINSGVITFIIGDSGCGKSTLLKLLNASISPTEGQILYKGKNLEEYDTLSLRKDVSLASQESFLFDNSIKENFNKFYSFRSLPSPKEKEIIDILKTCGIEFPLDKDCTTMSGGEKQRIFLSIFLSFKPKILLFDEPTSALDANTANLVLENIIKYCKNNNIEFIAVSHNKSIIDKFAQETIEFVKEGKDERSCTIKHY